MKSLEATKIARNIIRESNGMKFPYLYTNKYKTCRTVKAYWSYGRPIQEITAAVEAAIPGASVKLRVDTTWWTKTNSLIIRIPLDEDSNEV